MNDLRQREPRVTDLAHLAFIRSQPCCICYDNTSVEAHHPRVGSINSGVRSCGLAERASDRWALPLCGRHHRQLHSENENYFWASYGIDPFALAMSYRK